MTRRETEPINRRTVLTTAGGAIAAVGPLSSVAGATDETEWQPRLDITHDGLGVRMDSEDDPDLVTIYTADGTAHEFESFWEGGYHAIDRDSHIDDGWYGHIERVEATRGNRTVIVENDTDMSLEVSCSLWRTPNSEPYDFRMSYENAHKWYDGPAGDEPVYGSPGRTLQSVEDMGNELQINFDNRQDCDPDDDVAVVFDCTSVTVHPEEFVNGNEAIYRPELTFTDGSSQLLADRDELFEPPQTFEGTDEHEGKVIESFRMWNTSSGEVMFTYTNPDADSCGANSSSSAETDTATETSTETETSRGTDTPTPTDSSTEASTETPSSDGSTNGGEDGNTGNGTGNEGNDAQSDDQLGFGAAAGITSLGGAAYLANRFRRSG